MLWPILGNISYTPAYMLRGYLSVTNITLNNEKSHQRPPWASIIWEIPLGNLQHSISREGFDFLPASILPKSRPWKLDLRSFWTCVLSDC